MGLIANIRHVVNSEDPKTRATVIAAAVAAVLLAIAGMVYSLGDWGRTTEQELPPVRYFCMKCRHGFEITHDERSRLDAEAAREGRAGIRAIDCTREGCGGKGTSYAMFRCPAPECRKYFVTPADKAHYRSTHGGPPPDDPDELLCPHCGTDVDQWRRDHRP